MKKFYCDACDSEFSAEAPESGMPDCPKCKSAEAVSEVKAKADDCIRCLSYAEAEEFAAARSITVAEFHATLKAELGQDGFDAVKAGGRLLSREDLDQLAHKAATSPTNDLPKPTPAQIQSGNYRKGHIKVSGFDIAVENPEGSERKGVDPKGNPWSVTLKSHYGYIKRTNGADGDHVDVFVRPGIEPDYDGPVFVVYQLDSFGNFDEHKVMFGWPDKDAAKAAYLANYGDGQKKRIAKIEAMSLCDFKGWLEFPNPLPMPPLDLIADSADPGYSVLACDGKDGLCRIRQKVTRVDCRNKNRRIYRRAVANAAVDEINPYMIAGAVQSEIEHPVIVSVCDRGKCGERFVNGGPSKQVGRWEKLYHADAEGWIWGDHLILDTPEGRKIKAKIDARQPVGVSTRMELPGEQDTIVADGVSCLAPRRMIYQGIDVVSNPAVEGAGEYRLLSDSELRIDDESDLSSSAREREDPQGLGEPFDGDPRNTLNPPLDDEDDDTVEKIAAGDDSTTSRQLRAREQDTTVKKFLSLLRQIRSKVNTGACADDINKLNLAAADAFKEAHLAGEDSEEFKGHVRDWISLQSDAMEKIAGFKSGEEGPYGVLANELGDDPLAGYAAKELIQPFAVAPGIATTPKPKQDMMTADEKKRQEFIDRQIADADAAMVKAAKDAAVEEAIGTLLADSAHPLHKMDEATRSGILDTVRKSVPSAKDVSTLVDALVTPIAKAMADAALSTRGLALGRTTFDPSDPTRHASVNLEGIPVMPQVEKMQAAYDSFMRGNPQMADDFGWEDPDGPAGKDVKRRRTENLAKIMPMLDQSFTALIKEKHGGMLRVDSVGSDDGFFSEVASICASDSAAYSTIISNLYNQPTIFMWLLIQAFQDLRFLEFFTAYGPGQMAGANGNTPGWEDRAGFGRVFRVPSETFVDPSGFNGTLGAPFDLNVAENTGIPTAKVDVYWDTFAGTYRKIAATLSMESINAIGRGPLNYSAVMRHLWHIAARLSRANDSLMGNEMMDAALEYGAVVVTGEAYTTGGSGGLDLASNSKQVASGALSVNLNPAKTASAAIASTDQFRTYGTGNSTGGAAPVCGLRLQSGGGAGVAGTGTYFSTNTTGPTPVVPPRTLLTLTGPGADSSSTQNPVSVTVPSSQVVGWLGNDGNIYSYPGTTATCAVDWINGVLLFITGQTTRSGSVTTTSITVTYSYATNFDYMVLGQNNVNQISLGTGQTIQEYYSTAVIQVGTSSAKMGQSPNFVKPDLWVAGLNIAALLESADLFYKLNSPDGTTLFPDETFFARRNGVNMARVNSVTYWSNNAAVLTRRGTGRFAVNVPAEVRGPITLFDSNGLPIAGEGYYLAQEAAICTPQVKDINGAIVNAVSRALVFY